MNSRIPRAAALCVLVSAMMYVVAGEVLQGWVGLHMDAWRARADFGGEHDKPEWDRTMRGLAIARQGWPWKASLYHDEARLQLFGVRGGFLAGPDGGEAALLALDAAEGLNVENGDRITLEIRGLLLVGDHVGVEDSVHRLMQVAPNSHHYWRPLVFLLERLAQDDAALRPIARKSRVHFNALMAARFVP